VARGEGRTGVGRENFVGRQDQCNKGRWRCTGTSLNDAGVTMVQSADLGGRPLPGWRSGVARAGGRSSWRTRCGCGDKISFGPGIGAVKRLNEPTANVPQASSAVAIAVGPSILTLRATNCRVGCASSQRAEGVSPLEREMGLGVDDFDYRSLFSFDPGL
jgi:hypothetical protein